MPRRFLLGCLAPFLIIPAVSRAQEPQFSRHVSAVFSKLGCNGGTCHGAVKGQNGFRLTLFGADPALDHERLRREVAGRRLNVNEPDASLLLLKATGQASHGGGKRMDIGSPEYATLRRWIAAGAPLDAVDQSRLKKLTVTPDEQSAKPGATYRLKVEATFADGSAEEVTALCSYESMDRQVAAVDRNGQVQVHGVGDTALLVRFRAEPIVSLVLVPRPGKEALAKVTPNNFIDKHILAKLERLNLPPAGLTDDWTFLRRVSLDVAGALPTPAEIEAFHADAKPDKRARKIDELLSRPGYAALWALKFCDILNANDYGVYADGMSQEQDAPRFQQWVRARLEENLPYDQFAERILTATSREGRSIEAWGKEIFEINDGYQTPRTDLALYAQRQTLDLYWQRRASGGVAGTLQVAHSFLGLRLECAQCHRHPHDIWQQDDLLSFANFFMHVRQPGFQGDNEKKFPEVAAFVKNQNAIAKQLGEQAKMLRATRMKKLDEEAKKTKSQEAQEELKKLQQEVGTLERRSKALPEFGRHDACGSAASAAAERDVGHDHEPAGHPGIAHLPPARRIEEYRGPEGPGPATLGRRLDAPAGQSVLRQGDCQPRLGPLFWPRHRRSAGPSVAAQPADASGTARRTVQGFHQARLRSQAAAPHDLDESHLSACKSSQAAAGSETDRSNYAYFYYRRLPAEVLVDALNQATGVREDMEMKYHHWLPEWKTVEIPYAPRNAFVSFMIEQFGRPQRNSGVQCDCERDPNASVMQVLSLANHPRIRQKLADDKGQVARILKTHADNDKRIDEVFLCTLCRPPSAAERQACAKYVRESASDAAGLRGVMWSLLNTREFLLQH